MNRNKLLPVLAVALCVPGVVVRALHLLNGFDLDTGLPAVGDAWVWYFAALLVIAAVVYAVLAAPLRARREETFEQLLGTRSPLFRMAAVVSGLLLAVGGMGYLYLTMTTFGQDAAGWAKVLEMVYAVVTLLCGVCVIGLAKAQGDEMNDATAKLTLVPLIWSCLHLLVNYRMTCVDPKLASFAFGLVAEIEHNLISMRTREALALRKVEGKLLGRRKGSYTKFNVLIENRSAIIQMLRRDVSIARICKYYQLSRDTFDKFRRAYPSVGQAVEEKEMRRVQGSAKHR